MTELRTTAALAAAACVTALLCLPAAAEIYKWVDDKGVLHYTTEPPVRESQKVEVMQEHYSESTAADGGEPSPARPVHRAPGPPSVAPAPGRPVPNPGAAAAPPSPAGASPGPSGAGKKANEPPSPPRDSEGNLFPTESFDRRR